MVYRGFGGMEKSEAQRTRKKILHGEGYDEGGHQGFIGGWVKDRPNHGLHLISTCEESVDLNACRSEHLRWNSRDNRRAARTQSVTPA